MKIGLISDIHANRVALAAVLEALKDTDLILCAGDLTGYYTDPNGVITDILNRNVRFIIGNHDWYLDHPPNAPNSLLDQSIGFTRSCILSEYRQLLTKTAAQMQMEFDGIRVAMYHGSPWNPIEEYVYPDNSNLDRFAGIDADVIVLGHTHYPMIRTIKERLLINPGSCGQPRDRDPRASCAVFDTESRYAEIIRVPYDIDYVIQQIRAFGLNNRLIELLERQ